jgi:hypothetical protein
MMAPHDHDPTRAPLLDYEDVVPVPAGILDYDLFRPCPRLEQKLIDGLLSLGIGQRRDSYLGIHLIVRRDFLSLG